MDDVAVRPYDLDRDAEDLWELKRGFELGLGSGTGTDDKQEVYEAKLDDDYRERYLNWARWCVSHDERCVLVAESASTNADSASAGESELLGYVFVLPQQFAMIWDAAVLNEIFVRAEARGTGIADELMAAAVAFAESQNLPLDRLVLDVDRENDRAQAFYERHGFEHWGEMVAREL
ncbi:GNAT family N-acetyltransferase [Halorussus halophilus]|uniref:GNAT family N-acetyltransferase n=1 Tax=Halorussus halophilus TaxID=2650975 RepID=UPI001300F158|nr:GNAT family N-acetyltransferase [Halorussus halophilus]